MTTLTVIRTTAVAAFALASAVVAITGMLMLAAQATPAHALTNYSGQFAALQITAQTASNGVFDPAVNSEN
ncbi:MAG: hypothetical protein AAFP80_10960 [Pseudomonadota bacterium]